MHTTWQCTLYSVHVHNGKKAKKKEEGCPLSISGYIGLTFGNFTEYSKNDIRTERTSTTH